VLPSPDVRKEVSRQMRMTFLVTYSTLGNAEPFAYLPATPA
jgi:hypothetical protein